MEDAVRGILDILTSDPDLPSRIAAASAIHYYYKHERTMEIVRSNFSAVL